MEVVSVTAMEQESTKKKRRSAGAVPRWSAKEEEELRALVNVHGERSWQVIAQQLGTGRTPSALDQHWSIMMGKRGRSGESLKPKSSTQITHAQPSRVVPAYTCTVITQSGLHVPQPQPGDLAAAEDQKKSKRERRSLGKAQRWSEEEEENLKSLVAQLGTQGHWDEIAQKLGTLRTGSGVEQHYQILQGRRKSKSQAVQPFVAAMPMATAAAIATPLASATCAPQAFTVAHPQGPPGGSTQFAVSQPAVTAVRLGTIKSDQQGGFRPVTLANAGAATATVLPS